MYQTWRLQLDHVRTKTTGLRWISQTDFYNRQSNKKKKKKKTQTYLRFRRPIDGRFVVLQRLSFGLRSTPFLFASFTHAIKEAAYKLLNFTTKVYIHDWLLTNYSRSHLMSELTSFYELLDLVGVNSNTRKRNVPRE